MPAIAVIIPTWNRADLVELVVANVRRQSLPASRIIVVDNGSADETQAVASRLGVDLVSLPRNAGFAGAVNAGIAHATEEWLLILNNDVELNPDWLHYAIAAGEATGAGFVTGKILQARSPNHLDGTWDEVSRAGCAWRCGWGSLDGPQWSGQRIIRMASLTAALFRRDVFEKIGVLDIRFESYYEDVDLGLRCAQAGIQGVYEPKSVAAHLGSATLGGDSRMAYFVARNQILLLAKHYSPQQWKRHWWTIAVGQAASLLPGLRRGHLWTLLRGKWNGFRLARQYGLSGTGDVEAIFERSERDLRAMQEQVGFDLSWRIYFWLTRLR